MTRENSSPAGALRPNERDNRRILAIWFARFALDRWRLSNGLARGEGADAQPLALIAETAHGPHIEAVNDAGRGAGARPGMMLTDARALYPGIKVAPSDPAGDLAYLEKLALWAQRWGPWSALDPPDGLIVDVTAVAHLFGGEVRLVDEAREDLAARDLAARLAIAPTAGAAWALAHYGPDGAILGQGEDGLMRLAELPVAALRLDADVLIVLRRLGLKRIGDLYGVRRDALRRRFRGHKAPTANPLLRLDQLLGLVPEPLLPIIPHHAPLVQRRLMEPIRHRQLLDQVLADLAADMQRELEGRKQGARRLELDLWRVDGEVVQRRLEFAAATRDPEHICRLFAARLDDVDAGFGIESLRLRASWVEPLEMEQGDMEAAAAQHGTSLAACIDRLTVRLGNGAARHLAPLASHLPERAQYWPAPLETGSAIPDGPAFRSRPLKLLDRPEPITVLYATPDGCPKSFRWRGGVHEVTRVEGPERIAPEWWREKSLTRLRDYYRIEDDRGRRYWLYRNGIINDGRGGLPDWFLIGFFG